MKLKPIESIETIKYKGYVYDLEVEKQHSYNINGIIVHNSACATSDATGFNRGNITEIMECSAEANKYGLKIAADGGIKNGNYAAKAFGAGCFEGEMKVKTNETLKNIKDVKVGDLVLTHKNCYKTVDRIYKYNYKGKLKIINNIKCTPNHEFYVVNIKYKDIVNENNIHEYAEWIKAENLTNEFLLIKMD